MNPLKIAVIGVGALGQHHARILASLPDIELVAVADNNPTTGKVIAQKCATDWVQNYHDLFDKIDAVCVAVPTGAHLAVAGECLQHGIPTLVEKPLAMNVDEGKQLVKHAEDAGTILQVGHIERFNPAYQTARPLINNPKYIRAERLSPFSFRSTDIGVVHDLMIHDIDIVLEIAEAPLTHVEAFGVSILGTPEDTVQARLRFENGCVADLVANRVSLAVNRNMQIWSPGSFIGIDFGARKVTNCSPSETLRYGVSPVERAKQPGADIEKLKDDVFGNYIRVEHPKVIQQDALTAELSSFIQSVRTGRAPLVDGTIALNSMQVAEKILNAVAAHQWDGYPQGATGPRPQPTEQQRLAG